MARPKKKKPSSDHLLVREEPKTELEKVVAHLEENYKLYIAGAVFLLLCVAIGLLIRVSALVSEREKATLYAQAALVEDPQDRLEQYEAALASSLGRWEPEALYRKAETAIEAEQFDVAEETFNRLINDYPDSEYVPNAVDGLAFIEWNRGNLEAALEGFERVATEWPGAFIARRKHYDMGQVLEELERLEDAVAAYQRQIQTFPNSAVARRAQMALTTLGEEHPDLIPEEVEELLALDPDAEGEAPLVDVEAEPVADVVVDVEDAEEADATEDDPADDPADDADTDAAEDAVDEDAEDVAETADDDAEDAADADTDVAPDAEETEAADDDADDVEVAEEAAAGDEDEATDEAAPASDESDEE